MQRQGSFSQAEYAGKKKQTRRDKFLSEMEQVVPWSRLVDRLRPFYPKGERGRPPIGLERMLRLYFLQQWDGLADEARFACGIRREEEAEASGHIFGRDGASGAVVAAG